MSDSHERIWLLLLRSELRAKLAAANDRLRVVDAGIEAMDKLLATPGVVEGAERSPLAPMLSREGIGL
jgi:hypothetical protein